MKNETQNEIHFIGKVAQKAVIERDGRVLVIRDPRVEGIIWGLPGGRLNEGEDPKAGLAREIKEELGVDCVVNQVVYMTQFLQGNEGKNGLMIAYKATIPVMLISFYQLKRFVIFGGLTQLRRILSFFTLNIKKPLIFTLKNTESRVS